MHIALGIFVGVKLAAVLKAALMTTAVVAVFSVLTWERLREWFIAHSAVTAEDKDNIAFSFIERLNAGEFRTIYGIFNQRTGTMAGSETVKSGSLDDVLKAHHSEEPLVVYR